MKLLSHNFSVSLSLFPTHPRAILRLQFICSIVERCAPDWVWKFSVNSFTFLSAWHVSPTFLPPPLALYWFDLIYISLHLHWISFQLPKKLKCPCSTRLLSTHVSEELGFSFRFNRLNKNGIITLTCCRYGVWDAEPSLFSFCAPQYRSMAPSLQGLVSFSQNSLGHRHLAVRNAWPESSKNWLNHFLRDLSFPSSLAARWIHWSRTNLPWTLPVLRVSSFKQLWQV